MVAKGESPAPARTSGRETKPDAAEFAFERLLQAVRFGPEHDAPVNPESELISGNA